jgi:hypothetical protein
MTFHLDMPYVLILVTARAIICGQPGDMVWLWLTDAKNELDFVCLTSLASEWEECSLETRKRFLWTSVGFGVLCWDTLKNDPAYVFKRCNCIYPKSMLLHKREQQAGLDCQKVISSIFAAPLLAGFERPQVPQYRTSTLGCRTST